MTDGVRWRLLAAANVIQMDLSNPDCILIPQKTLLLQCVCERLVGDAWVVDDVTSWADCLLETIIYERLEYRTASTVFTYRYRDYAWNKYRYHVTVNKDGTSSMVLALADQVVGSSSDSWVTTTPTQDDRIIGCFSDAWTAAFCDLQQLRFYVEHSITEFPGLEINTRMPGFTSYSWPMPADEAGNARTRHVTVFWRRRNTPTMHDHTLHSIKTHLAPEADHVAYCLLEVTK